MIYITQIIHLKKGKRKDFNLFERTMEAIINEHKGRVIYRLKPRSTDFIARDEDVPSEIQIISFETLVNFENYKNDYRRHEFIHLKENSISRILLIIGQEIGL